MLSARTSVAWPSIAAMSLVSRPAIRHSSITAAK
jgi:hypothetical protein